MKNLILKILFFSIATLVSSCGAKSSKESNTTRVEDYAKKPKAKRVTLEIVGKWYDDSPYIENHIAIYKDGQLYTMKRKFKDGSELEQNLMLIKYKGQVKFIDYPDNGNYFIIKSNGDLDSYDKQGYIKTIKKQD